MSVSQQHMKLISESGIYKSFFENYPDAICLLDLEGNYIDANPACTNILGYSHNELLSMSFKQIIAPEKLELWLSSIVAEKWLQGVSTTFETSIYHKQGHRVELEITDTPIVTDGKIVGVIGIAKDITKEKDTEKKLRERSERYESLKNHNPNGICAFSLDGSVIGANPAYERITGYSLDELRQINVTETLIYPENRDWARKTFKYSFAKNVEMQIRHKNGYPVDVNVTSVPIIIDDENIGVYIILEHIGLCKQLQNELLKTQRLFRLISENSQDIISCGLPDGTFAYVSPSVKPLLGYDPSDLIGKPISSLYHPEDISYLAELGRRILSGEDIPRFTCRVRCKNGNYLWYETTLNIIWDENGNFLELVGVGRDVSEQVQLQESLEYAVNIARLAHWEWDIAKGTTSYSRQSYRNLGMEHSQEVFTYERFKSFVHPEDVELWEQGVKNAITTGGPFERVFRIVRMDGSVCYLHSKAEVLIDEAGVPVKLIGVSQDITSQKVLELQLQESEERYRRLVENSLDAIGIFENRKWVFMNSVGLQMFGATNKDEIIGRDYFDFLDQSHHEESKTRLLSIMSKQHLSQVEYKMIRVNGEAFYAEVLGSQFSETAVQVCIRDITERKRTDEMLVRSEKLTAVGQLAASVAHEIRNPLTALKGFVQLMHEKARGSNKHYFEVMQTELIHINQILDELLLLAKPQAEKFTEEDVDLLLQEVVSLMGGQAIMNNVVIVAHIEKGLPSIRCAPNQLKQVFINVMKNAIEAMPAGGTLTVRATQADECLKIVFADEGGGIPEDQIPKLGEPFFTTKAKGTGLGLMVSHKIISAHKGSIEISSEVGKGTTVSISLPLNNSDVQ